MNKAITGLVFLALVFGVSSTATTILSTGATTVFDSTATADSTYTAFLPSLSAVGPGTAATSQYFYGVTGTSTVPTGVDTKTITVDTSNAVTEGSYSAATPTITITGSALLQSRVLAGDGYYCLITLEAASSIHTVYAYWWLASDTTGTAVTQTSLKAAAASTTTNALVLSNAWYYGSVFYVTVVEQNVASSVYTDANIVITGLDVTTAGSEAALSASYTAGLSLSVTSAVTTNTIEAKAGCYQAASCTTITAVYYDGTNYIILPLVSGGTQGTSVTLTLPTDASGTTSTYVTAGVVGLSSSTLTFLSRAANDGTTTTYTLVAYEGAATNSYSVTPGTTATGAITIYWSGLANGNTEPSIIVTYTSASGTTYDYLYTTVGATADTKIYTFASNFDNAPSIFVDATPTLWCAWAEGSSAVTSVMVSPLSSSTLMSAVAFVAMMVVALFAF